MPVAPEGLRCSVPGLLVVREHHETRVLNGRQHCGRGVRGSVVDDDQLQIVHRLPQHTLDGCAEEARVVVDGQ